jgi:hypothetical protein
VAPFEPAARIALISLIGLVSCPAPGLAAGGRQATDVDLPVSLGRIRAGVDKAPSPPLDLRAPVALPVATFKTTVEQRAYMLSFEEQLHKELELTPFQRQSQEWASKCCGLDLDLLLKPIDRALQRRKERKVHEQIAGELAELEARRRQR